MGEDKKDSNTVEVPKWALGVVAALAVGSISTGAAVIVDLLNRISIAENEVVHLRATAKANTAALNLGSRFTQKQADDLKTSIGQKWAEHRQEHRELRASTRDIKIEQSSIQRTLEGRFNSHANLPAHVKAGLEIGQHSARIKEIQKTIAEHNRTHRRTQ